MEWKYSYQLMPTNALVLKQLEKAEEEVAAQLLAGRFDGGGRGGSKAW